MFYKSIKKYLLIIFLGFMPFFTNAKFDSGDATSLVSSITGFINKSVIPVIVLLALVYVMYGIFQYIKEDGGDTLREEKKQKIFWGIIGLFVILSVWAIVFMIANTFDLQPGGTLKGI
ncbi:MAG: hypothetical protein LR005_02145 [Candidatus Pacebacteria bacterium]|nr:hypothetical protein [Candidatus Paceibacterota bacterium]